MVIIRESDLSRANEIFRKYNTKPIYSILPYDGQRYIIFEKGIAAALIEVDMKMGYDYKEGRIYPRAKIQSDT